MAKHTDDGWKTARPQNKNLIPVTERSREEMMAISRKGGQARAAQIKKQQDMKALVAMMSELPITDGRVKARMRRMGIPEEEFTQKLLVADALIKAAQTGSTQAIDRYLELTGESGGRGGGKKNNILDALGVGLRGEEGAITPDDIPEIFQAPEPGADVVGET